jgi:HD-GYP domain-containing protein (c-di-GMP phosphodiesterase class II)
MAEKTKYDSTKILLDVSRAISSSLDLDKVSALVLKESRTALGADHASLFLIDEKLGHLVLARADGFSEDEIDNIKLFGSWEVISRQLVCRKEPLVVNDIHKDTIFREKNLPFSREKLPVESFMAAPLEKDGKVAGVLIVSNRKRPGHAFTKDDEELLLALSANIAISVMNARLYQSLKSLFISTITSLTRAIDAKDRYTSGHSERVMKYAVAIGREMGISEEMLENIRLASLLHDVGKIGIKESILMKPAKLLGYERRQVKQHPGIGARIIETIDNSHKVFRGVLEHHERWDGRGYPGHLKGEGISLEGRVIAVADTFDALTTNRPYQKGHSRKMAFEEIKKGSATQFDPAVVKAFISSFSKNPELWISKVSL